MISQISKSAPGDSCNLVRMSHQSRVRTLIESLDNGVGPALEIDEVNCIIKGVNVLGRRSKNRYLADTEGTEYSAECQRSSVSLIEGATVATDHNRENLAAERKTHEIFGALRNVRVEGENVRADLHYLGTHPLAPRVVEDVKRRLGRFALSINALGGRERHDKANRRLVIESLETVRGVDLVTRPGATRNLWESEMSTETIPLKKTTTFRQLVESQRKRFVKSLFAPVRQLVEDDAIGGAVMDAPEADTDPDDALWSGFRAAINAVLDKYESGDLDVAGSLAKIKDLLKSHDKISDDGDGDESETDTEVETDTEKPKVESLSNDQRELALLRREKTVRQLCESAGFAPTAPQFKALLALDSESDRRELMTELSGKPLLRQPRSAPRREVAESQQTQQTQQTAESPHDAGEAVTLLRGGW